MDLKGIMLIEISQRKTITVSFHLYVESKKKNKKQKKPTSMNNQDKADTDS